MGEGVKRFGLLVKQAREEKGWTLQELADELDLDVRTVQKLEQGEGNPSLTVAANYFFLLNISPNVATYELDVEAALKMDRLYRELQGLSSEQFELLIDTVRHARAWRENHPEIITLEDYGKLMGGEQREG